MRFAVQFKKARLAVGLSQNSLAKRLGVTWRTIDNWEANKTTPKGPYFTSAMDFIQDVKGHA